EARQVARHGRRLRRAADAPLRRARLPVPDGGRGFGLHDGCGCEADGVSQEHCAVGCAKRSVRTVLARRVGTPLRGFHHPTNAPQSFPFSRGYTLRALSSKIFFLSAALSHDTWSM